MRLAWGKLLGIVLVCAVSAAVWYVLSEVILHALGLVG